MYYLLNFSLINLYNKDDYFIVCILQFQSASFMGQFQSFIARGSTNSSGRVALSAAPALPSALPSSS